VALSAFDDRSKQPQEADLAATLGEALAHWNELQKLIADEFAPVTIEWGFTNQSTGWGLRLKTKKRTIVYMTPCQGYFLASFALGEKAVQAAHDSKLPDQILKVIDSAKKYAEGRGVRVEVRTAKDVRNISKLANIKMAN
jgi:hypothetical protein